MTARPDPPVRAVLWRALGAPLLRLSPQPLYRARVILLRLFGATLDNSTRVRSTARIQRPWNLTAGHRTMIGDHASLVGPDRITIGSRCTVSQLCALVTRAHNPDREPFAAPITIEDDCWIAADTLVMPGAHVRRGALVGARSMIEGELPEWRICAGEPARPRAPRHLRGVSPEPA